MTPNTCTQYACNETAKETDPNLCTCEFAKAGCLCQQSLVENKAGKCVKLEQCQDRKTQFKNSH